ncbi:hypothetical protein DYB25_005330 [Aphanomyces astaci]|uniref:Uncharacterized protein n=1 Tax=Aphanomyces astaci TaxID=112090 RepID=A0A397ETX9_APHAT|nr:hypothetical protein DYB25_005330 [Aphanomyces astaci]RHY62007.1 hypothetical protein DYB34_010307 [Aphanomyces astaci]RHY76347.1 hypothetical protein DYB38_013959 [Aphanomyces astaci]RHZ05063.1 hypothetical protein DYB31_003421 [Aphanomyces astaci]RHZ13803.1 hypothetical protein DYB26_002442 [Aphanomyces astaci]
MASLPRVKVLRRIPETSGQQQGYPLGAVYGDLPAQSYRPQARQLSRGGNGLSMVMTKGVSTECGFAPALQQHELQVTAHRERIAADRRQAHFEW